MADERFTTVSSSDGSVVPDRQSLCHSGSPELQGGSSGGVMSGMVS